MKRCLELGAIVGYLLASALANPGAGGCSLHRGQKCVAHPWKQLRVLVTVDGCVVLDAEATVAAPAAGPDDGRRRMI